MTTPTNTANAWLEDFEAALTSGDLDAASALFADDSYWRNLVTFT